VNGKIQPIFEVQKRRHRFRVLQDVNCPVKFE
jgi:hypothetical protein